MKEESPDLLRLREIHAKEEETLNSMAYKAWVKYRQDTIYAGKLDANLDDEDMNLLQVVFFDAWLKGFEFRFGGEL
jgi:hypothetical protein